MNYLETAKSYLSAGLSVLPAIRDEKRPALPGWKQFQLQRPSAAKIESWFEIPQDAISVITGAVSGNLELLDFDFGALLYDQWAEQIPADLLDRLVIESSRSGGRHVIYRCQEPVCGNIKLAQDRSDGELQTLIETRGEGGLFLCSPTEGYELIQGELTDIPVLTADERECLLEAAWTLNQVKPDDPAVAFYSTAENRPGDEFNERGNVRVILEKHGWVRIKTGANEYWRRPGKSDGWSATLKDNVFYVFSGKKALCTSELNDSELRRQGEVKSLLRKPHSLSLLFDLFLLILFLIGKSSWTESDFCQLRMGNFQKCHSEICFWKNATWR